MQEREKEGARCASRDWAERARERVRWELRRALREEEEECGCIGVVGVVAEERKRRERKGRGRCLGRFLERTWGERRA